MPSYLFATLIACLFSLTTLVSSSHATILFSESFDYADGNLPLKAGGVGFADVWEGGGTVNSGVASLTLNMFNGSMFRKITPYNLNVGQPFYVGMDFSFSAPGTGLAGLRIGERLTDNDFFFGQSFGESNASVEFFSPRDWVASSTPISTSLQRMVMKIERTTVSSTTLSLYASAAALSDETSPDSTITRASSVSSLEEIRVSGFDGTQSFDNIVGATSFVEATAIPEPGAWLLLSLCSCGIALVRRFA